MIVIKGTAASPGIAIGKAYVLEDEEIVVNRIELPRELLRAEVKRFRAAQKAKTKGNPVRLFQRSIRSKV